MEWNMEWNVEWIMNGSSPRGSYLRMLNTSSLGVVDWETATVWQVVIGGANFRGKALRINFRGFKFRDSNPVQGRGTAQTMM